MMVAARHGDFEQLRKVYASTKSLLLTIDGIQPEKGHETLYVVRELGQKRVWFAEPLLSSALRTRCDGCSCGLGRSPKALQRPVAGWMSDKQDAFLKGIAAEFPGVPHGYCQNHFLRDLAKPVLEEDSHAKVQMRRRVRGLRSIEQAVLAERSKAPVSAEKRPTDPLPPAPVPRGGGGGRSFGGGRWPDTRPGPCRRGVVVRFATRGGPNPCGSSGLGLLCRRARNPH